MGKLVFAGSDYFIPLLRTFAGSELYGLYPAEVQAVVNADIPQTRMLADVVDNNLAHKAGYNAAYAIRDILNSENEEAFALLDPYVTDRIRNFLPAYLVDNLKNLAMIILCLDKVKPNGILLHNDVEPVTRMAALWARERGVPCLHIPHAVYLEQRNRAPIGADVHDICTATNLAVAGWFQRQWYEERGFNPENIREIGVPRFDKFCTLKAEKDRVYSIFKINPKFVTVVYASSWWQGTSLTEYDNTVQAAFLAFLESAKNVDGVNWVIKLHPRAPKETDDWHVEAIKAAGIKGILIKEYNELIFQVANCLVMYGPSNIAFEAGILGVPLISINGFYNDPEVITVGIDAQEMQNAVKKAVMEPKVLLQSFLLKYIGLYDGQSMARAVEYAHQVFKV